MLRHPSLYRHALTLSVFLLAACAGNSTPYELGADRFLFLDTFLLDQVENARIVVNPPRREDLVVIADKPWEAGGITSYGNAFWDPIAEEYKLYYVPVCWDVEPGFCTALATSKDGIHWEKPNLGVVEWKGSKDNNIVLWGQREGTVLIDHSVAPDKRYSIVSSDHKLGTRLFTSPDGIHFTMQDTSLHKHQSDSQISTFWDDQVEKFIHFFKVYQDGEGKWHTDAKVTTAPGIEYPQEGGLGRSVARLETATLDEPWKEPFEVVMASDSKDPARMDLYTNAAIKYTRAPNTYFAFPTPYYHYNEPESRAYLNEPTLAIGGKRNDGVIETQLATSRDGKTWTRHRTPYIPLHRYDDLDLKVLHIYPGILVGENDLVQYYAGYSFTHGDTQVRYKNLGRELGGVFRVVQRLDGFTSLDFAYGGGTVVTEPFVFEGNKLLLNVNTSSAGEGRVAILDADGKEIPGFTLDEARYINGDYMDKVVEWKDGASDVSSLAGKPIRLSFNLRGSKLYSFRFAAE